MIDYNPLVYFWIAEYETGQALPQFDPHIGKENKFGSVQHKQIVAFGWYPFTVKLAARVTRETGQVVIPLPNPFYRIELKKQDQLIAKRTTHIYVFKFHQCGKCGFVWQQAQGDPNPKIKLLRSNEYFVEQIKQGKRTVIYKSAVCPKCGYHGCNAIMRKDKKIKQHEGELRETFYILGKARGKVIEISEDGSAKEC